MKSELTPLAQIELSIEIVKFYSLFLHDIKSPPEWVLKVIILSRKIGYESDINTTYCHKHHLGRTIVLYTPIVIPKKADKRCNIGFDFRISF